MDTVVIDGVTYTKASTLAKEFRYTTDYIGQLCRAEKVGAQLVGRSWYVSRDSLEEHAGKRVEALRQDEISLENNHLLKGGASPMKVFAPLSKQTKKMLHSDFTSGDTAVFYSNTRYESDPVDLLPVMQIRPNIPMASVQNEAPVKIEPIINHTSSESKSTDKSSFSVPINQHKPVKILSPEDVSSVIVHTHVKNVANQSRNKQTQAKSDITASLLPVAKPASFTPSSIAVPVTSRRFPYKSLALAIFLLGIGAILTTLALDMEIHYDGTISSTSFSINQTALVNLFR